MNKETLLGLSTGDVVINTKTSHSYVVVAAFARIPETITIDSLTPIENWNLEKSRLEITKEELARIKKYHEDLEKQLKNQK